MIKRKSRRRRKKARTRAIKDKQLKQEQWRKNAVARELSRAAKFRKERRDMYHKIIEITPDSYLPVQDWVWLTKACKRGADPDLQKRVSASNAAAIVPTSLKAAAHTPGICAGCAQLGAITSSFGMQYCNAKIFGRHGVDYWWVRQWRGKKVTDGAMTLAMRLDPLTGATPLDYSLTNDQLHALCDLLFQEQLQCRMIRIAYTTSGQYYEEEAIVTVVFGDGPLRETWWCGNNIPERPTTRAARAQQQHAIQHPSDSPAQPPKQFLVYKALLDPGTRIPATMFKPEKRRPALVAKHQWVPDF